MDRWTDGWMDASDARRRILYPTAFQMLLITTGTRVVISIDMFFAIEKYILLVCVLDKLDARPGILILIIQLATAHSEHLS
jgi:hypothetical protein